jgi:hypothetical protein
LATGHCPEDSGHFRLLEGNRADKPWSSMTSADPLCSLAVLAAECAIPAN